MHVLMLSDVYFPRVNGVSTSIRTFRRKLLEQDVRVSLIVPHYPQADALPAAGGDDPGIVRVKSRKLAFDPEDRLMRYRQAVAAALAVHASDPVDIVHVQTPFVAHYAGLKLAATQGVPLVSSYHTLFEEYVGCYLPLLPEGVGRRLARQVSRHQCNQCHTVIVPSTAMRDRLSAYGVNTALSVLPTGIDTEQFAHGDGDAFRRHHLIARERPMLLFVGRLAHEKNIGFLLRVIERLRWLVPDVLFLIAGEGPAQGSLERDVLALDIGKHVLFVGNLDRRRALPDCYAAADAFVFASRTETQGLVLLEAMSVGTPVVALSIMGTRDILGAGQGCVVPDDDVDNFTQHVLHLLRDPERRRALGVEARQYAERWHDRALANRLHALYQELAANPDSPTGKAVVPHPPQPIA